MKSTKKQKSASLKLQAFKKCDQAKKHKSAEEQQMPATLEMLEKIRQRADLISTANKAAQNGGAVLSIPLDKLVLKEQVRKKFDESSLKELADSIASIGQQQPITVIADRDRYRVVSGERRVRAMKLLNKPAVLAVLASATDEKDITIAQLVENLQREDMSPYEIELSFDSLTKNGFFSVEELAAKIGKSIRYVYKMLTTVKLPQELTGLLETRVLNDADGIQKLASTFTKYPNAKDRIIELVKTAAQAGSVSRTEIQRIADLVAQEAEPPAPRKRNEAFKPLEDVEISPGNASQLKKNPAYSHYKFPGGNIRIDCMFQLQEDGEYLEGQVIPNILTDDYKLGIVESDGKLFEVPWLRIHVLGVRAHKPKRFDAKAKKSKDTI